MAAYCQQSDLVARFGVRELAQLTDETAAATPDDAEIAQACDEASSLIDSYLSARYVVPLTTVPTIVRMWACNITRAALWKDRAGSDSPIVRNRDDALAQLRDVAKGVAGLPDATGTQAPVSGAALSVSSATRVFDDTLLSRMPGIC